MRVLRYGQHSRHQVVESLTAAAQCAEWRRDIMVHSFDSRRGTLRLCRVKIILIVL